jgi:dCMP deaminase
LDKYPETDYDLLNEAGVEIVHLEKTKIVKWAKELVSKYEKNE